MSGEKILDAKPVLLKPPSRMGGPNKGYVQVTAYLFPEQIEKVEKVHGASLSDKFRNVVSWVQSYLLYNPKPYRVDVKPRGRGKPVVRMTLPPSMIEFVRSLGDNHKFSIGARRCVEMYHPLTLDEYVASLPQETPLE